MKYWIYLNNEKSGPYSVEQLIEKTIPPTTLVWCEGMSTWLPANEIAELSQMYNTPQPPSFPNVEPPQFNEESLEELPIEEDNKSMDEELLDEINPSKIAEESEEKISEDVVNEDVDEVAVAEDENEGSNNDVVVPPIYIAQSNEYHQVSEPQRYAPQPSGMPPHPDVKCPPTYLVWAILTTLCCCQPFGIVAIVFAANVRSKYDRGDIEGAAKNSEKAALWVILAFVVGLLTLPLQILVSMI